MTEKYSTAMCLPRRGPYTSSICIFLYICIFVYLYICIVVYICDSLNPPRVSGSALSREIAGKWCFDDAKATQPHISLIIIITIIFITSQMLHPTNVMVQKVVLTIQQLYRHPLTSLLYILMTSSPGTSVPKGSPTEISAEGIWALPK